MSDVRTGKSTIGRDIMGSRLYKLLCHSDVCSAPRFMESARFEKNLGLLRATLTKPQRRLLLRILDDTGLIHERHAKQQFSKGFRIATKIMIEALYFPTGL